MRLHLASLEELGAPARIHPSSPSKGAAVDGWRYLVVAPGEYFLLALPPGMEQNPPAGAYDARLGRYGRLTKYAFEPGRGGYWSPRIHAFVFNGEVPADFVGIDGFRLEVPPGSEVLYAGSLSVTCSTGRGLFGDLVDSCSEFQVLDESEAARQLASQSFAGLTYSAQVMSPYEPLRTLADQLDHRTDVEVVGSGRFNPSAANRGLSPSAVIPSTIPAINVLNVLVMGGQALEKSHASAEARQREEAMRPCADRLTESVAANLTQDLATTLKTAMPASQRLSAGQVPDSGMSSTKLTATIAALNLREAGSPDEWALELGVALRVEGSDTHAPLTLAVLVSGPDTLRSADGPMSALYSTHVGVPATPRPRDEWCGPDGPKLMSDEVNQALKNIGTAVMQGSAR
jgi:hypothetical protein